MPILYSAVAFRRRVLFKRACCDGNFDDFLNDVINKVSSDDYQMTYCHGRYLFHFIMESGHLYFCITDKLFQRSRAFLFLKEIKRRYEKDKGGFTNTLSEQMMVYNDDEGTITIHEGDIDDINRIGVESSESLLGEKILTVKNYDSLQYSSISYETKPVAAVISFNNNNYIIYVVTSIVIAIALLFVNPTLGVVILFAILYSIVR